MGRNGVLTIYKRDELDKFYKADPRSDHKKIAEIADRLDLSEKQAFKYLSRKRSFYSEKIRKRKDQPSKREVEKMNASLELMLAKKRNIKSNNMAVSYFLIFKKP